MTNSFKFTARGDRELVMIRVFDAPRHLVFDAWTKPALLKRWLGPRSWSMTVCEVDLKIGGTYRFVWRGADGSEMGMGGVYREIVPGERLAATETFDVPWYPGGALATTILVEHDGKTTATTTIRYELSEARDIAFKSGMERGAAESYDRLEELCAARGAGD
ncbi:MAG TPA: SRPBCC family protein [Stellaceae bacterium]|nr:SRPBCC family protein [Stellaceae bacterium]